VVKCASRTDDDNVGCFDDVIVKPEVVSVHNGSADVIATVGLLVVGGAAVLRPEVITCSGDEAVHNGVPDDEITDVLCDVFCDVRDEVLSVVS